MRKYALAIAAGLIPIGVKLMDQGLPLAIAMWSVSGAIGLWALLTTPSVSRIALKLVPAFLRPVPRAIDLGIFDVWANAPRLGELFVPYLRPIRQSEEAIAAISAEYRPRLQTTWFSGAGSQGAAQKSLRLARREARAINRRLDRIEKPISQLEQKTKSIAGTFRGMEQRIRAGSEDRAGLTVVRDGMRDLIATMEGQRGVDESFRGLMTALRGPSAELNASSDRGAALATRVVGAHDEILSASRQLLKLTDDLLGGSN